MKFQSFLRLARSIAFTLASLQLGALALAAEATFVDAPGRRDIAYDATRKVLYISGGDYLLRYDVAAKTFLTPVPVGGMTLGMDISPDGNTLAVANSAIGVAINPTNQINFVNLATLAVTHQTFPLEFMEGGTFTVAYDRQAKLLVSSQFQGSGWVPLRKYDPATRQVGVLGSVRQDSMLSPSSDGSVIAIAESNISNGPYGFYKTRDNSYRSLYFTGWFNFEIAVSARGAQAAVPTYGGTFIQDPAHVFPLVGEYAGVAPIGAAYGRNSVYFPMANTNYVAEYDMETMTEVRRLTMPRQFQWGGNSAFGNGRTKVASDNSYLFVTVDGGVAVQKLRIRRGGGVAGDADD